MSASVAELWRFPVKSLQGEPLDAVELGAKRIDGDREWGVIDRTTGKLLSAKTVPALLEAAAVTTGDGIVVRLPSGDELRADGSTATDALLSAWLDRSVALRPAAAAPADLAYQMTFDPPNDSAQLVDIPTPPGTFLDLAPVHLLTDRSLASCAASYPEGEWDRRRFRPNVFVAADADGEFPEDAWVGRTVQLGSARVRVLLRTVRCALPLRAQPSSRGEPALERDVDLFRAMSDVHDNHLGVYAEIADPGRVAVGDALTVE